MSNNIESNIDESVLEKLLVDSDGNVIDLSGMIQDTIFTQCRNCPLSKKQCKWRVDKPTEEYDDHCRREEGLIIEGVKEYLLEGGSMRHKMVLKSLFTNLIMVDRMSRIGSMIDYTKLIDDPTMLRILDKYSMMLSRADRAMMNALKELQQTPKEQDKKHEQQVSTAAMLQELMKKADQIDDERLNRLPETEGEKGKRLRPSYEDEMDEHDIEVNNYE